MVIKKTLPKGMTVNGAHCSTQHTCTHQYRKNRGGRNVMLPAILSIYPDNLATGSAASLFEKWKNFFKDVRKIVEEVGGP